MARATRASARMHVELVDNDFKDVELLDFKIV